MTDRDLLDELLRDLTTRWMRAERDGYGDQRQPEKQQATALRGLIHRIERMFAAEKLWDFEKWNDSGPGKHAAAAELADAIADLRRSVTP